MVEVLAPIGRITGEVAQFASTTINIQNNTQILNSPVFAELQSGLLQVCAAHPEARADIVSLFRQLDERHAAPALKTIEGNALEIIRILSRMALDEAAVGGQSGREFTAY